MNSKKIVIPFLAMAALMAALFLPASFNRSEAAKEDDVQWLVDQDILNDEFEMDEIQRDPSRIITRQEYITLMMRVMKQRGTSEEFTALTFADKNQVTSAFQKYIAAAHKLGTLKTADIDGKLYIKPNKKLTKQMAAYYTAKVIGVEMDLEAVRYNDYKKIANKINPSVTGMIAADLIEGGKNGNFEPVYHYTWKDAAGLIQRVWDRGYFKNVPFEIAAGEGTETSIIGMALLQPTGIIKHNGRIYIADTGNSLIKSLDNGKISLHSGRITGKDELGSNIGGYVNGNINKAAYQNPTDLCSVEGGMLVVDTGNHTIRFINSSNQNVSTYAGSGVKGLNNGAKKSAQFNSPMGITNAEDGVIYIADTGNNCIRKIDKNGKVTTYAGIAGREGYKDGKLEAALFNRPTGITIHKDVIYVADTGNQRIRKIENGMVTTIAGSGTQKIESTNDYVGGYQDGAALEAEFDGPVNIASDLNGVLYISDSANSMIRVIKDGRVSTLAGSGNLVTNKNRTINDCLASPEGLFVSESDSSLYVADSFYNTVIRIQLAR